MLKIEQQVCGLESAKRLKELGVAQKSYFFWAFTRRGITLRGRYTKRQIIQMQLVGIDLWSAFTSAELDEYLMKTDCAVLALHDGYWVFKRKVDTTLEYGMIAGHGMGPDDNGAERRATLLIYLLENELLDQSKGNI